MVRGADVAPLTFELLAPSEGTSALDFHRMRGHVPDCSISRPCSTARSSGPLAEVHVACRRTAFAAPYARGLSHTPGVLHSVITGCRLGPAAHACFLFTPGREFLRPPFKRTSAPSTQEVHKTSFGEHTFLFSFFFPFFYFFFGPLLGAGTPWSMYSPRLHFTSWASCCSSSLPPSPRRARRRTRERTHTR